MKTLNMLRALTILSDNCKELAVVDRPMSEWAVNALRRFVRDLDVYLDGRNTPESALDTHTFYLLIKVGPTPTG